MADTTDGKVDPVADLGATLALLWPGGQVRAGNQPGASAQFVALPGAAASRVLLPASQPRSAARAVLRFSGDSSAGDVARRALGAAWLRVGGLHALPRISVHGDPDSSLQAHLGDLLGTEVTFSLSLGSARVNRKPVLQVFDQDGATLAFAKLGVSATSRQDVVAESVALRSLERRSWRRIAVPQVLHLGRWRQSFVLLLSPLPAVPRALPIGAPRPPLGAMLELERAYAEEPAPLAELPWLSRIREAADQLGSPGSRALLQECIETLVASASASAPVRVGAWHGDWTPWNMSGGRDVVQVWDWERFETGVPTGLDPLHFAVNVATRSRGTSVATVFEGLTRCGASPHDRRSEAHLRAGLYLLAVAARYLPLAEGDRGADIAPRARCVLDALAAWTGVRQSRGSTGDPSAASR